MDPNDFWSDIIDARRERTIGTAIRDASAQAFEAGVEFESRYAVANSERKSSLLGRQFGHRDIVNSLKLGWELDDALDRHLFGCPREFLQGEHRATPFFIRRFHDNGS